MTAGVAGRAHTHSHTHASDQRPHVVIDVCGDGEDDCASGSIADPRYDVNETAETAAFTATPASLLFTLDNIGKLVSSSNYIMSI